MPPASTESVDIAILTKAPQPGRVKTRLTMLLGSEGTVALHKRLISHTLEMAVAAGTGTITIWASPDEQDPYFQDLAQHFSVNLARQPEGDLGARMHAAIAEGGGPTLVIGTDCPALTPNHLRNAAEVLRGGSDAVVFPAEDGGYVLIGLRRPVPGVFIDIPWSTDGAMLATRQRLRQLGLSWREPTQLWDVDRPTDVRRMRHEGLAHLLAGIDKRVSGE